MFDDVCCDARWLDEMMGVVLFNVPEIVDKDKIFSTEANQASVLLLDDINAFDEFFLSRVSNEDVLSSGSTKKSLLKVYFRVLKKTRKLQQQLEDLSGSIDGISHEETDGHVSGEASEAQGEVSRSPGDVQTEAEEVPGGIQEAECVCVVPHHLDYEASEISIAPGANLHLPMPVPRVPPGCVSQSQVSGPSSYT